MKKLTTLALAIVLILSLSVTAFAAEDNRNTTITTSIDPTYTVTIPADTNVTFNTLSSNFGAVTLTAAQIDPGYAVQVALIASGTLKNQADASKTIPYTIKDSSGVFTSARYTTSGDKTDLTIDITQEAWNTAFAGAYSDTVTFTVSYINTKS